MRLRIDEFHYFRDSGDWVHGYVHSARTTFCGLNKSNEQKAGGRSLNDYTGAKIDCQECADSLLGMAVRAVMRETEVEAAV